MGVKMNTAVHLEGDLPTHLKSGATARLFPVLSENSKEGRATSVFLATISIVDSLADALLARIGRPVGKRSKVRCFTEVVFQSDTRFRPDGLIVVETGGDVWSALVESKIGKSSIESQQIENYLRQARENKINCVITISNQLVTDPTNPPVSVDGRLTRSVPHYHYSWLSIRSEAEIAFAQATETDPEKRYILSEFIRFLAHKSAGVEGFVQMPAVWPELIREAESGRSLRKNDQRIMEVAEAWLQEEKELSLIISRLVNRKCVARSERNARRNDSSPLDLTAKTIVEESILSTEIHVPDTAAPIHVVSNIRSKASQISMRLRAPEDRQRPEARLNWLLNQIKDSDAKNIEIVAHWPGRAKPTTGALDKLREDPKTIAGDNTGMSPYAFDVAYSFHSPSSFSSRQRFIRDLEAALQDFYGNIGRRLSAWAPKAPKPNKLSTADQIEESNTIDAEKIAAVEKSLAEVLALGGFHDENTEHHRKHSKDQDR